MTKTRNQGPGGSAPRLLLFGAIFAAATAPLFAAADVTIQNQTYGNGQVVTKTATNTVTANTNVTVQSGANVSFYAGTRITLGPGFTAGQGSAFRASIDSDGDGLPDWWETEHGLDPQSASGNNGAAGNPDGDALSNLMEFRSGSNPNATTSTTNMPAGDPVQIHRPREQ